MTKMLAHNQYGDKLEIKSNYCFYINQEKCLGKTDHEKLELWLILFISWVVQRKFFLSIINLSTKIMFLVSNRVYINI